MTPLFARLDKVDAWQLLVAAWVVALLSTLGALFISEIMGQAPCNLCWFQRAFMFPLAVVLGVAALLDDRGVWRYALPLAAIGLLIAVYHLTTLRRRDPTDAGAVRRWAIVFQRQHADLRPYTNPAPFARVFRSDLRASTSTA